MDSISAVIVAAGSSRRMGFDKLTAPLCGRPVVRWTLEAFEHCEEVVRITLVCPEGREDEYSGYTKGISKLHKMVPGGTERVQSVINGLTTIENPASEFVAVHDAARPLITSAAIRACARAAREHGAAVCAEPVADTLQRAGTDGEILETLSRDNLWRMQTPQIAGGAILLRALEAAAKAGDAVTDEVSALLNAGEKVRIVPNVDWNFKVTYPRDLALAGLILKERKP